MDIKRYVALVAICYKQELDKLKKENAELKEKLRFFTCGTCGETIKNEVAACSSCDNNFHDCNDCAIDIYCNGRCYDCNL